MPRLIAVDWGTTNLRARLLGDGGRVIDERAAAGGIMAVQDGRFAQALLAVVGDWLDARTLPLIASGMIGSRQGWREAPYLACPARRADAAAALVAVDVRPGITLHIAPGLRCIGADGCDDVMRGEETQAWGAALPPGSCCVLPGTHSKWAWTARDDTHATIERFATYLTGELWGVLTKHSILGRLMVFDSTDDEAFARGAALGLARPADVLHTVFAARTAGLMNRLAPAALPDFLSGILIGAEVGSATRDARPERVTLLGEPALCRRYAAALELAGIATDTAPADATTRGQWQIAHDAGLVEETT